MLNTIFSLKYKENAKLRSRQWMGYVYFPISMVVCVCVYIYVCVSACVLIQMYVPALKAAAVPWYQNLSPYFRALNWRPSRHSRVGPTVLPGACFSANRPVKRSISLGSLEIDIVKFNSDIKYLGNTPTLTHPHAHARTHAHIHTYTLYHTHTRTHARTHIHTHTYTNTHMHTCAHMHTYTRTL